MIVIVIFINVYLRMVFRISLEFISFKLSIYLIMLVFLLLRVFRKINFKFLVYDKMINFKEV